MYLCRLKLRHSIYMTTLDIILLVLIGTGAVLGFAKGFLRQLAGLLGLIVGLLAAKALYATVADEVFSQVTDDAGLARGLAFVAIWLLVAWPADWHSWPSGCWCRCCSCWWPRC